MDDRPRIHILVVDDLPDKLLAMEQLLADLGPSVNVVTARSGREALRRLLERDFAVILLDVNMPDIDGFETARLIRQRKRSEHTPIIFVTGFSDEMHAARGYSLGAVDYILAPVVPEVLRTKVSVFVELYQKSEQVRRQAEERVALAHAQAAQAAALEAQRRSEFLAEASTLLANSLDLEATVRALLQLALPALADVGAVTVEGRFLGGFGPAGVGVGPTELAWFDRDGTRQARSAPSLEEGHGPLAECAARVLATGRHETVDVRTGECLPEGEGLEPWHGLRGAAVLPLQTRGRTLGVLALGLTHSGRVLCPADLDLAGELSRRAATAIDNARLYRDLQEADRRKDEFLAMLAHELRNPLAPLRNALQILRLPEVGAAEAERALAMMDRQVQHLVRMVDDLLDVSRLLRGKVRLRLEPVSLGEALARAVETAQPVIDARGHQLTVELPEEPVYLEGDLVRLAQVFANLLHNAAKYSEKAGPIAVSAAREGEWAVVRVRDQGVGIEAGLLPRVFDLFVQADASAARSQGGLGIGLTLVKRLVEMHGGAVSAWSAGPGRGAEFTVRLPALAASACGPAGREECERPTNGTGAEGRAARRVLVVDDNVDAAESLALVLRAAGHRVWTAHSGPAALQAAPEVRPEAVVLDIGLPGMDGYEVARRLRGEASGPLLVALTGYGQDDDRRRSREAGFHHHLVKPVDPEELERLLAQG
jgi:signal transduction histidine kinase/DNA-binding response OmpR family regulator